MSLVSRLAAQLAPRLKAVAQTSARRKPSASVAQIQGLPDRTVEAAPGAQSTRVVNAEIAGVAPSPGLHPSPLRRKWDPLPAFVRPLAPVVTGPFAHVELPPPGPERQIRPYIGHPEGPTPNEYPGDAEYSAELDAKLTSPCRACDKSTKNPSRWCADCQLKGRAPPRFTSMETTRWRNRIGDSPKPKELNLER